jgi:cellulose synthase/poly-beta-1,6-N-acetylglucosamine synthase-like glycosyltransferase
MLPKITILIAAYNEEDWIAPKIQNTIELDYPESLKEIIVISDGSTDKTPEIVTQFQQVKSLFKPHREGKMAAIDRAVPLSTGDIIVFTDANTMVNKEALNHMVCAFENPEIGLIAGEKRVISNSKSTKIEEEGLYWKYESWLKKLDSEVRSVVGAAGELFAIRKELYKPLPKDTLLDDFMLSMHVLMQGKRIAYVPEAYATEVGSLNLREEWKRKVRIGAGGIQSTIRSFALANPFKYGVISYTYIVHRIARWTIAPLAVLLNLIIVPFLALEHSLYVFLFIGEFIVLTSLLRAIFYNKSPKNKFLKSLMYFVFMNISVVAGWVRYLKGSQTVLWDRAKRAV